jgi:glucose-1-phosphate cytidylyltransferase
VELLGKPEDDWRVLLIDTGIWRNITERLCGARDRLKDEQIILTNYEVTLRNLKYMADGCFV